MSKAATIKVFVIIIDSGCGNGAVLSRVGALYLDEEAAKAEVKRLKESHWETYAYILERELPWPEAAKPLPACTMRGVGTCETCGHRETVWEVGQP